MPSLDWIVFGITVVACIGIRVIYGLREYRNSDD